MEKADIIHFLKRLPDNLFAYAAWLDFNERILELNHKTSGQASLSCEDVFGKDLFDIAWWNANNEIQQRLRDAIDAAKRGETIRYDLEIRLQDNLVPMDFQVSPVTDEFGNIQGVLLTGIDISSRKKTEENLREREEQLAFVLEGSELGFWDWNLETGEVQRNARWAEMLGYTFEEIEFTVLQWMDFVHPEDRERAWRSISDHLDGLTAQHNLEYRMQAKNGSFRWIQDQAKVVKRAADGRVLRMSGTHTDISDRKSIEEKLRLTARVFETTLEGILITNANQDIIEVNDAFTRISGYSREELIGKNPRLLKSGQQDAAFYKTMWQAIHTTGHWSGEIWNRRKNGEIFPEWMTISAIQNDEGDVSHYVGISSDISLLKQHEKQLKQIAHYDALTGIPNRILFLDRMQQALTRCHREQNHLAICYLDLDGFKPINDKQGHATGDKVLIKIAERIAQNLRGGDTVARLGGDEFVILLVDIDSPGDCFESLDRLLLAIQQPIAIVDQTFKVTASIGVTLYPQDNEDPDTLFRHADQAMYIAKQSGKNRFHIFDPSLDARLRMNREQRIRIAQGLLNQEFELFYQPKVELIGHGVVGAEALIRWRHPEKGLLVPLEFLPAIENTELEIELGEWVIDTALAQLAYLQQERIGFEVSINIVAAHLQTPNFVERLRLKLAQYPALAPEQLQIEILESAALADIASVSRIIDACIAMGVRFALDDFGTGYSSLAYLRRLPVDTLKIDQSFIRDMLTDTGDYAIVEGIIALANTFRRTTVAEGVETQQHLQALVEMGCHGAQGYGIAHPMRANELLAWCQEYDQLLSSQPNVLRHQSQLPFQLN